MLWEEDVGIISHKSHTKMRRELWILSRSNLFHSDTSTLKFNGE